MDPLPRHAGDRAPEAVARALASLDPQLAELLSAQCARLRDENSPTRVREKALLDLAAPRKPRVRGQFAIDSHHLFSKNLTRLDDGERSYVWVYDDDAVSLDNGLPGDPWGRNVEAGIALRELFRSAVAARVTSIRLCLFGGVTSMAKTLDAVGASELVTHLELRTQNERATLPPVSAAFPSLVGLACDADEVPALLARGAPALRALAVRGKRFRTTTLDLALRAPRLRHLALHHAPTTGAAIEELAMHPILDRLTSLEIFATNHARSFPFTSVLERREAFAYLRRFYLAGHLVADDVVKRFDDWPEVELVTWDRRETMAWDFEMFGWGAAAR